MTPHRLPILAAALLATAAGASAQSVSIENFIGRVDIVPGSALSLEGGDPATSRLDGSSLVVDGGESMRGLNCSTKRDTIKLRRGKGLRSKTSDLSDYPSLRITAPAGTTFEIEDSVVIGRAGDLASVDLKLPKCGRFAFGDVSGILRASVSGSADISAGRVGEARLASSGSGDFDVASADALEFASSGSGDLKIGSVSGPASARSSGSGDSVIESVDGDLVFRSSGSGDLAVGRLNGAAELRSTGSGDMTIGEGDIPTLSARSTGSGDLSVGGRVGDADLVSIGSGDFDLASQDGDLTYRTIGSGDVRIGGRKPAKR